MSTLEGMVVDTTTSSHNDSSSENLLYVGVVSEWGGREFPLKSQVGSPNGEALERFVLGSVWDRTAIEGGKAPNASFDRDPNDPRNMAIDLDLVTQVYLGAMATLDSGDMSQAFDNVTISLFGSTGDRDDYQLHGQLWLGNSVGRMIWFPRVRRTRHAPRRPTNES